MSAPVDRLTAALAPLPRVALGTWPTPLVRLERLGAALGLDLWMKRDDCSGLALGGNKARKLEFVLGDAVAGGAPALVTVGPITSNHTMMTAAAGRRLGLPTHVVLGGEAPPVSTGNLALTELFGAEIHFTPLDPADPAEADLAASRRLSERLVRETGGYWIPPGASMPESIPGYASAVAEILDQCGGEWPFEAVVVAYGTGSTSAGLLAGLALAGVDTTLHAVAVTSPRALARFAAAAPDDLVRAAVHRYGWSLDPAAVAVRHHWWRLETEPGYGLTTAASREAMRRFAIDEGFLLDPTYTAKAAAALIAMAGDGRLPRGGRVLFIHTGGLSTTAAGPTHR